MYGTGTYRLWLPDIPFKFFVFFYERACCCPCLCLRLCVFVCVHVCVCICICVCGHGWQSYRFDNGVIVRKQPLFVGSSHPAGNTLTL